MKKLVRQANFAIVAPNDYTVSELRENEFKTNLKEVTSDLMAASDTRILENLEPT